MDRIIVKKKVGIFDAVKQVAMKATTPKGTYYFMPFWFKECGTFDLEVLSHHQIPQEIKDEIQKQRNNANNEQQTDSAPVQG